MSFKYSLVIPTYNNYEYIIQCLNSVFENSPGGETEIIIIDNGSTDGNTPAYLQTVANNNPGCVTVITNKTNTGFCVATNQGMEASTGDYVVWLNDDTIVTRGWLQNLQSNIDQKYDFHPNIGMTGPVSNFACSSQRVCAADLPVEHIEQERAHASMSPGVDYTHFVNNLSGFCMMIKREVIDKIGYIDELYSPGGFCDNDFCLRAVRAGFGALISPNVFIYHFGSKTLEREFPDANFGLFNWAKYINKHRSEKKRKIIMVQAVKIDDDYNLDMFKWCSAVNLDLVDGVVLLSDRSENFTYNDAKEIFGDKLVKWYDKKKSDPCDGIRDREVIIEAAKDPDYDWVVYMDHDECFGPSTTPEKLQKMMNPYNPSLNGYSFLVNTYWRNTDLIRVDGSFGGMVMPRMWRNNIFPTTLRQRFIEGDKGFHAGNRPLSIASSAFSVSSVTIDHYGYHDFQRVKAKQAFYEKEDNLPEDIKKEIVGPNNYDHLTNETGLELVPIKPFTTSINMMIKNEETTMGNIILNLGDFVDEMIIIDTGSTDKTMEYLDLVGVEYSEIPINDDFSEIRNKAIELTTSDYCFHMDADEQLCADFTGKLLLALNRGPDLIINTFQNMQKHTPPVITRQPRVFRKDLGVFYSGYVHETIEQSLEGRDNLYIIDNGMSSLNTGFLKEDDVIDAKLIFYGRLLEKEIADNPENAKAYLELAAHYRNIGKRDDAIDLLISALQIKYDYLMARKELAIMYMRKALDVIKQAEGQETHDEELTNNLRAMHADLNKWSGAEHMIGNPKVQRYAHDQYKAEQRKLKAA